MAQEVRLRCTEDGAFVMEVVLGESEAVVSEELHGLDGLVRGEPVQFEGRSCMGVMLSDGESVKAQVLCGAHIEFSMPVRQFSALLNSVKPA